jgi:D-inositol-3-phosphate glycosyltransferase
VKRRVALVTHALNGGVWTVTTFLHGILRASERYEPNVILLATSLRDPASVRLLPPKKWLRGPQILAAEGGGIPCIHVGAVFTEFEFQRYKPRPILTDLLNRYDLIQVVGGTPAWAGTTRWARPPVCVFVATTAQQERTTRLQQTTGWRGYWLRSMTQLTARLEERVLSSVASVFAESEYTLRLLGPYVNPARLHLAPPGVDTGFFCPDSSYRKDGYLIAVGRFQDSRKNVRMLLEAYRNLRKELPQSPRLFLVGQDGLSPKDWAYAVSLGLGDHIRVHKNVSPTELRALYKEASVFVFSSDEEGLGLVILEAMASGLPVVGTDCGGPATAVLPGKTGLLTPVGDSVSLAKAMHLLLGNPEMRRQMGRAARQSAEERFSLAAAGKVYLDKYDELLASSP